MENSTKNIERTILVLLCRSHLSGKLALLVSAIYFFLSIATILGNALILFALCKVSSLHPPSKLLFSCLAVTDLLVGLISEPASAVYFMMLGIQSHYWMNICAYSTAIAAVSFTILTSVSLLTLTAISVDRLLALSLGLRYRHVVTLRRIKALAISFWIPSIAFASMMQWNFMISKSYGYALKLICLLVSAVCYSKIFFALRHHQTAMQDHVYQEQTNRRIPQNMAQYRKTVSTAVWILLTLVACYLPYSLFLAIITTKGSFTSFHSIWTLTGTLVYLNSFLNPILYCWKMKEVRNVVKNIIKQLLCFTT